MGSKRAWSWCGLLLQLTVLLLLSLCQCGFVEASRTGATENAVEGNYRVGIAPHVHHIGSKRRIFSTFISDNLDPSATLSLIEKAKGTDVTDKEKAALLSTSLLELIESTQAAKPGDFIAQGTSTYDDMNIDGTTGEGSNAEEGLAEETPQCFSEMRTIFGGLFGCLSGNDPGTCCEGNPGMFKFGEALHANGIIQHAVSHVRSWLQ